MRMSDPGGELEQANTEPIDPAELEVPPIGARVGKFTVEGLLGAGGMSVVVSARDPELDRSVALKLVRGDGGGDSATGERTQRLLREARAMAALRHPNVLTIHEAGSHGDRVYVAMERVAGGTLRQALAARAPLYWQDVIALYAAAGRGLAAAHAAGLVHRDFKPDNVLVDGDRVLVADFGLVSAEPREVSTTLPGSLGDPLTRDDLVIGTPAYMAPEQHAGASTDARTDQFAFCVSLYEALYGELPFPGSTRDEYVRAILAGAVRQPPARDPAPPWVREALMRGLRADPRQRFESMTDLLAALTADPDRDRLFARFRRFGVGVVAMAVVAWAGAGAALDAKLTYPAMLYIDTGCLVLIAGFFALSKRARMVAFNRKVIAVGAAAVIGALTLLAGGALAHIPAPTVALLHLFSAMAFAAGATILLDRRIAVVTAGYFVAFLLAAARPNLFYIASLIGHGLMAAALVVILGER